jgi:hypothetical protein
VTPAQADEAVAALRAGPVADVGHLLKAGGLRELGAEASRLAPAGLSAHVVVVPADEPLAPWHGLWARLGYSERTDLLLLFNGRRWEARGWGLSGAAIEAALVAAEPALRQYYGRGLTAALENLARATDRAPARPAPRSSSLGPALGVGGLLGAVALGWVIVRRRRRAAESRRSLADARSAAEQVFSEVVLATEEMPAADATALREKATRLRDQLDALAPPGLKQLPAKEESLTLAKLQQMENELEALRSSVLQVKRRR